MMKNILLLIFLIISSYTTLVTQVNFLSGAVNTGMTMWAYTIGISLEIDNAMNHYNNSLFQAYQLNALLNADWLNAWTIQIKSAKGHKYLCDNITKDDVLLVDVDCSFDSNNNQTYWTQLGTYIKKNAPYPFYIMGYDMQGVNLKNNSHGYAFYTWTYQLYTATGNNLFDVGVVDYGDKWVQKQYRTSYTPEDFLSDIQQAVKIASFINNIGPGITDDAGPQWLLTLPQFTKINKRGHFTVRSIIFPDPTQITIQKILSDNSTKYYLKKRFTVNSSLAYDNFAQLLTGISDVKLTQQPGVDGVTNTFAAAIWAVDMLIQFTMMSGYQLDFNHKIFQGNFQAILGPAPDYKPTALYYGLMFATIVRDGSPTIIIPSQRVHLSSKIKAFGLSAGDIYKILIMNKDTNTSLNGTVQVFANLRDTLTCYNMQAPSLEQKQNITIAGYHFTGGNASVQGTFKTYKIEYNQNINGYQIPIKYAQVVLCSTKDSKLAWPKGRRSFGTNLSIYGIIFSIILMFIF